MLWQEMGPEVKYFYLSAFYVSLRIFITNTNSGVFERLGPCRICFALSKHWNFTISVQNQWIRNEDSSLGNGKKILISSFATITW